MAGAIQSQDTENPRIVLGLLESVERDGGQSQRRLASELGIALGLVNAYLKRCVKKGLVKVAGAPARRYAYYLTPQGFAEKSRLTVEYLSVSFSFFRQAKTDCALAFEAARTRGFARVALLGVSDLAEIATICAHESGVSITVVIDPRSALERFVGIPVSSAIDGASSDFDAVVVTDLLTPHETVEAAVKRFGADRVLVPALLAERISNRPEPAT
jgi:DNA-binding MarR family transcriptional regulator